MYLNIHKYAKFTKWEFMRQDIICVLCMCVCVLVI